MPKKPPAKKRLRRRRAPAVARASRGREMPRAKRKVVAKTAGLTVSELAKLDDLRRELEGTNAPSPLRWNADPDDVQRSVAQLVLTLVEFIRKLLERQAIRRMEAGTLTDQQTEDIGRALMKLEETVIDIAARFGVLPEELNLDLGPIGKLL
jgi:gas vesicle protein GvpK